LLPLAVPAVGVLAGGAQPVGDLGLAGALLEQAGGAQSDSFHLVEVTAVAGRWVLPWRWPWPLLPQPPELLGRIMASEHVALFRNPLSCQAHGERQSRALPDLQWPRADEQLVCAMSGSPHWAKALDRGPSSSSERVRDPRDLGPESAASGGCTEARRARLDLDLLRPDTRHRAGRDDAAPARRRGAGRGRWAQRSLRRNWGSKGDENAR
jgi:hypothetical protein